MNWRHGWFVCALLSIALVLGGCGGGSSTDNSASNITGANVQAITVGAGPTGEFLNMVMTSVTICVPGTSTCQTIPNVQVDTGSSGLRILASAITIALPAVTANGSPYSECAGFADGVVWGNLATADIKLSGETASSVSLQVIQDSGVGPTIPASCSAQGTVEDTQATLGANGIIGVGPFLQDCGAYCVSTANSVYYVCATNSSCAESVIPLASQVSNPAAFFAQDNNGVILQLASIPSTGAITSAGQMIFGIGTQSNNSLSAGIISVPDTGSTAGMFTATYRGTALPDSFFDSGSSVLYFDDSTFATCSSSSPIGDLSGLYCPGTVTSLSPVTVTATITGISGNSLTDSESVANAQFLLYTQSDSANLGAFNDLGGPVGSIIPNAFDFGVPFFFGKSVYTGFEQRTSPNGTGPYFAYQSYP